MAMTEQEYQRFGRHLVLPEIGVQGQEKLLNSKVLIIGCGGLGSPVALYLTAAGIGTIGLVDMDIVDISNLQRQVLYTTADIGRPKVTVAAERLRALNPNVKINEYYQKLDTENALEMFADYDCVVDGTDNFSTRYLVSDACVLTGRPDIYGSVFRFDGQVSVLGLPNGPCYRCLFPTPPDANIVANCSEGGILGVLPGMVGAMQANEVIKFITGIEVLHNKLLLLDAADMRIETIKVKRNPDCPICGDKTTIRDLSLSREYTQNQKAQDITTSSISASELCKRLNGSWDGQLLDIREPCELSMGTIEDTKMIPANELIDRLHEIDKQREIIVICQTGTRSQAATKLLNIRGFNARFLKEGLNGWKLSN